LRDDQGCIASRANIKGFAFEYMTSGRGLVLGDPGPWLCSGMTGGVVYLRVDEMMGLNEEALRQRLASGADVLVAPLEGGEDEKNVKDLLTKYISVLTTREQKDEVEEVRLLMQNWRTSFVKAWPKTK
jgi:glutamate synthase (NADPH) large chain